MAIRKDENHAIIVRIDWNEYKWVQPSSDLSYANNFGFVRENQISYTAFNFAHELYEPLTEPDGNWYGLIPAFWKRTPKSEKIINLKFVILISNYENTDFIVGLFACPTIAKKKIRTNKIKDYEQYDWINIGSLPSNIIRFENYINLNLLDHGRAFGAQETSKMGWNYLNQSQVGYVLDCIDGKNSSDRKFKKLKLNYFKSIK
jgi:hypothetical protein